MIYKEGDLISIPKPSRELQIKNRLIKAIEFTPAIQIIGIALLFVMLIGFGAWSFAPKVVETKYFLRTKVDTIVRVDTVVKIKREVKTFVVDKSWGNSQVNTPVTNKKNFIAKDDKEEVVNVGKNEHGFTRYQMMMWSLKNDESFKNTAYPDGKYYSVGFGFNMNPDNKNLLKKKGKLNLIKGWGKGAKVTWQDAIELTQLYIDHAILPSMPKGLNTNQQVALAIKAYNSGKLKLGACCGGKKTCGKGIKHHNQRRAFEWKLYHGKVTAKEWETIRNNAIKLDALHK